MENKLRYSLEAAIFKIIADAYYQEQTNTFVQLTNPTLLLRPLLAKVTSVTPIVTVKEDVKEQLATTLENLPEFNEKIQIKPQPTSQSFSISSILRSAKISFQAKDPNQIIKEALKVYFFKGLFQDPSLTPGHTEMQTLWAENPLYQSLSPVDQTTLIEMCMNRPLMNQLNQAFYATPAPNFGSFPYFFATTQSPQLQPSPQPLLAPGVGA